MHRDVKFSKQEKLRGIESSHPLRLNIFIAELEKYTSRVSRRGIPEGGVKITFGNTKYITKSKSIRVNHVYKHYNESFRGGGVEVERRETLPVKICVPVVAANAEFINMACSNRNCFNQRVAAALRPEKPGSSRVGIFDAGWGHGSTSITYSSAELC